MEENNRNSTPIEEIESSIGSLSLDRSGSNYEENRDQSTITITQFWQEDPIEENLDPNFGRGQDGEPNEEGPPPYEQANAQAPARRTLKLSSIRPSKGQRRTLTVGMPVVCYITSLHSLLKITGAIY